MLPAAQLIKLSDHYHCCCCWQGQGHAMCHVTNAPAATPPLLQAPSQPDKAKGHLQHKAAMLLLLLPPPPLHLLLLAAASLVTLLVLLLRVVGGGLDPLLKDRPEHETERGVSQLQCAVPVLFQAPGMPDLTRS